MRWLLENSRIVSLNELEGMSRAKYWLEYTKDKIIPIIADIK